MPYIDGQRSAYMDGTATESKGGRLPPAVARNAPRSIPIAGFWLFFVCQSWVLGLIPYPSFLAVSAFCVVRAGAFNNVLQQKHG